MKHIKSILFASLCILCLACSKSEEPLNVTWGAEVRRVSFQGAKNFCAAKGQRLPNRAELNSAFQAGLYSSWEGADWYWSGEEASSNQAYLVDVANGDVQPDGKDTRGDARCVKK